MRQYIVDAFTDKVFSGNQAAVCVMDSWPDESLMMNIARENNFSETAFTVKEGSFYRLRWFTPKAEVDLCGHATLATAYVVLRFYEASDSVAFTTTKSGELTVKKHADLYAMDFPAYELESVPVSEVMREALGVVPEAAYMGRDLLCILKSEDDVRNCVPDLAKVSLLDGLLVHITARGHDGTDCVSRSFAPKLGISEDPVCGSAHCHIVPYWSGVLGRKDITAYQASERGGYLYCSYEGERVIIAGRAALYSRSEILEDV